MLSVLMMSLIFSWVSSRFLPNLCGVGVGYAVYV